MAIREASSFIESARLSQGTYSSVLQKDATLYGSVYGHQGLDYLNTELPIANKQFKDWLLNQQNDKGLLVGPELLGFSSPKAAKHDYEHLSYHSTCSALPLYQELGLKLRPIYDAHKFLNLEYLSEWVERIDWKNAWFEGNNILFVGQLLVYLRDVEKKEGAQEALGFWFNWLEREIDPETSLWGTNGFCTNAAAVYGGYHQLLVYWHEDYPIRNPEGLVDTVLGLQHYDGGFNPAGNAGACEDVDSIDILVNCYKRFDYKRAEIRVAVWRAVDHILKTQNEDGGFPYNRNKPQSHMGIPGTDASPNESCMFPTWFRVHTLALANEIIPDHPSLKAQTFKFNTYLSMGWHKSPLDWSLKLTNEQFKKEKKIRVSTNRANVKKRFKAFMRRVKRKLKSFA